MKRQILLLAETIAILIPFSLCVAQTWKPVGSGVGGVQYPTIPSVYALTVYENELYVGGYFGTAGGHTAKNIAKWNGSIWTPVGSGFNGAVEDLCVYDNELYACGYFDSSGTNQVSRIAKWNGTNWASVSSGISGSNAFAMCVFNNQLVVAGEFGLAGGVTASSIAQWNGSSWTPLGATMGGTATYWALTVHKNKLVVGGQFSIISYVPANGVAQWNGSSWSELGSGIVDNVMSLSSYNGQLYAGSYTLVSIDNSIKRCNDTIWSLVNGGTNEAVNALYTWGDSLYVGGKFNIAGGSSSNFVALWNDNSWSPLGNGISGTSQFANVQAFCAYANELYVGGNFTSAGDVGANSIARWSPTATSVENHILRSTNYSLSQNYPNPFNPSTTIHFSIPKRSNFSIKVFDILGRLSAVLKEGTFDAGDYSIQFDGSHSPSGIYFVRLQANEFIQTRKIILTK